MDLLSDKFIKALISATQAPDEESGMTRCLGFVVFEDLCKALTFYPTIISYAGWQGGDSM